MPTPISQGSRIGTWRGSAETLLPLIDADEKRAIARATEVVNAFPEQYERHWLKGMRAKLGLVSEDEADLNLATGFLTAMEGKKVDYTLAFRYLADAALGQEEPIRALFADPSAYDLWSGHWRARLAREAVAPLVRAQAMRRANPAFIPRNHRVEEALSAAVERGDYAPFATLAEYPIAPFRRSAGVCRLCRTGAGRARVLPNLLRHLIKSGDANLPPTSQARTLSVCDQLSARQPGRTDEAQSHGAAQLLEIRESC